MTDGPSIRILVADDHAVVRSGIVGIVNAQNDLRVIADVEDGAAAVKAYQELRPDVALIDLQMPILDGVGVIQAIRAQHAAARIVILTTYDTDDDIERALTAGARAYVLKDIQPKDLVDCIRAVHAGKTWIAPDVAAKLADRFTRVQLTARELEILKLIAKGLANKEIGKQLNIAEGTVKVHIKTLFEKLMVNSRTDAMRVALERGLIRLR